MAPFARSTPRYWLAAVEQLPFRFAETAPIGRLTHASPSPVGYRVRYVCQYIGLVAWLALGSLSAIAQLSPVTFSYNGTDGSDGSAQTYTVPTGIYNLSVVAFGAAGVDGFSGYGGQGGKVEAHLKVTPGQMLTIYVGGTPPLAAQGYNGGGKGAGVSNFHSGGGGGATDIRLNGNTLNNRVIVAGGGGGGGDSRVSAHGGNGGGITGGMGDGAPLGGGGGTQTAGGAGGPGSVTMGQSGSLAIGGDGFQSGSYFTGAGGGGYYGGGSGGDEADQNGGAGRVGGGGGGSSYTDPTYATNIIHTQGVGEGNGQVTIVPLTNITLTTSATPSTVCAGSRVAFSVTVTNGTAPYSYTWAAPAGITLSATSTSAVSASVGAGVSGVRTLTITAAASGGSPSSTSLVTLTVNGPPTNVSLVASGTLTCARTSVTLTASATGGTSYVFSNPGVVSQNATSGTAVVNASGTYSVTVTNANGCTATQTSTVSSNTTTPTASLSNNGPITCAKPTVTLTAGGGNSYSFSSGATPAGNTATVSQVGTYTVTVTNTINGCSSFTTTTVTSNTTAPTATLLNDGPITCTKPTVTLTAGGGGGYAFSSGATPNGNTATVSQAGIYTVTVTNTTNGCSSFTTTTVASNTTVPTATLLNDGPITCAKPTVTLTAGGGNSYSFSSGATPNGSTATVSQIGTYTVTVTNTTNGCSSFTTTTVNSDTITPTATLNNNGPLADNNSSVTLTAGGGSMYTFSSGATQQNPSAGNTATVTNPGTYQVTVTAANGCIAIAQTTVTGAASQTICRSSTTLLSVLVAPGSGQTYQWYKNGQTAAYKMTEIASIQKGTTTTSLTLVNNQTTASYYLKVTDGSGAVSWYGPIKVSVNANCNARLATNEAVTETHLVVVLLTNPLVDGQLRAIVQGAEGQVLQADLLDMRGHSVRQQRWSVASSEQVIDWEVNTQPAGLYVLQVATEGSNGAQRQSLKVIKP